MAGRKPIDIRFYGPTTLAQIEEIERLSGKSALLGSAMGFYYGSQAKGREEATGAGHANQPDQR